MHLKVLWSLICLKYINFLILCPWHVCNCVCAVLGILEVDVRWYVSRYQCQKMLRDHQGGDFLEGEEDVLWWKRNTCFNLCTLAVITIIGRNNRELLSFSLCLPLFLSLWSNKRNCQRKDTVSSASIATCKDGILSGFIYWGQEGFKMDMLMVGLLW